MKSNGHRGFLLTVQRAVRRGGVWALVLAMALQIAISPVAAAMPARSAPPGAPRARGVIVRYRSGASTAPMLQSMEAVGLQAVAPVNGRRMQVMSLAPDANLETALDSLRRDPRVEYAEPNYELAATVAPSDTLYTEQWGLSTNAGIWAEDAWTSAANFLGGGDPAEVTVAVLDTGVDATHEDLSGRVLPGHNAITGAADPTNSDDDSANGHGTHVAGIVAASTDNGLGVAGTAGTFPVQVLPVKVLDSYGTGTLFDIAEGIRWAVDQGARIINLSLGARLPDYPVTLAEAVKYAQDRGVLVVAAAGNEGFDLDGFYPASLPGVVSVGASGTDGQLATFSNQGSAAIAPGVDILSTLPGDEYGTLSGTSMAAPFVSGTAALAWTVFPDKSAVVVAAAIADGHTAYGSGLVLNANLALTQLDAGVAPQPGLELLQPQGDAFSPGRHVSGTVQILAQAFDPASVSRLDFILNQGQADETVIGSVYGLGGPAESGLFELNWDSTQVADGQYELSAHAYDAAGNPTGSSLVMIIVANQQATGLALKVLKPDGTPAAGAQAAVFHAYTDYSSVPYSSLTLVGAQDYAYLNYEWVWEGTTDLGGDLIVSGASATDGNDYLVIVRGSDFLYHRLVRAPSQAVLDASEAQTVTITGQTVAGQPLVGALLVADLLEASVPLTTDLGAAVVDQYPLVSLGSDGQAEFTVSPGHYNFRLVSPADSYYLAQRGVVVNDQTSSLEFTPQSEDVATLELSPDIPPESTAILLNDYDDWGYYGFIANGTSVTVTPGTYVAEVTSLYPDASAGVERLWTVRTDPFQLAAQATHRIFLGSLASAELSDFGSANPSGPAPGSSVNCQLSFLDAYGNKTIQMLSQTYAAGATAAAADGLLPAGVVLQRSGTRLDPGVTGLSDAAPAPRPTAAYNPATGRFEPVAQGLAAMNPTLEVRDASDSVIHSGPASTWYWGSWYIPLATPLGAYTIRAKADVGNLGPTESGGVVTSNANSFDVQTAVPPTPPPADLTVTVLDRNGEVLPGARATLLKQAGDTYSPVPWKVEFTDPAGQASFRDLYYRGDPLGLAVTGVSADPAEPGAAAEPFFIFVSLGTLTPHASITVDASASPMHRIVVQAQNAAGTALDGGNVPYFAYGEDTAGRQGGVYIGNPNTAAGQPLWLREGRYAFQAANDGRTLGRPTAYALLSGPVDVPAGVPTDGTTGDKTVVLGGPGLAAIQVSSEFDSSDEALQGVAVFRRDTPGAGSPFYSLLTTEDGPLVPIYVAPGTYQVQALATRAHYDGEWDYWLESEVSALGPADQGPAMTAFSLDLGAAIQLDSSTYSPGSTLRSTHSFMDTNNNRLIGMATNLDLAGGSSLQAWRLPGQTHEEIAPFLTILDPSGNEIYRHKDPATTFFGDTYVIPATAAGGTYTAILELGAGPDGDFRVQTTFTVDAGSAVPQPPAPPPSGGGGVVPPVSSTDEEDFIIGPDGYHLLPFDGVLEFTVPADAFPVNGMLVVRRVKDLPRPSDNTLTLVSPVFEFESSAQPQRPVDLTIHYDPAQLNGADPRTLGVYRQDDQDPAQWTYQGGVVALDAHTVRIRLSHFSRYAVMARSASFADLAGHWSRQDVELLASRGLVAGVTATEFQPDRPITRAELTKLLVEMLSRDPDGAISLDAPATPTFDDVAAAAWYWRYVETAARLGFVKGANGLFRPGDPVTREEMATMFARALGLQGQADNAAAPPPYSDTADISSWATSSVAAARQAGLMQGQNGSFQPQRSATRAQAAVVVLRAMERKGWVSALVELTGVLAVSEVEGRHYELEVASPDGTARYVLLPIDGTDGVVAGALTAAVGKTVTITALPTGDVSIYMQGPVMRVTEVLAAR